jgi:2-keto-4-pentenoate hydratase/2-oxohepta-3-ene-1,7-dioic acid hydratase in catechol pathway
LNYANHAQEAKVGFLFRIGLSSNCKLSNVIVDCAEKPTHVVQTQRGPCQPRHHCILKQAQDNFLGFEGELTIVTSKAAKNVSVEDAPSYILGYTIGNDLTARHFQAPASGGGQFSYAKSFDEFAPLGPALISSPAFGEVVKNKIKTSINGRVVQDSPLDLIWGPAELVSFLSQGRT